MKQDQTIRIFISSTFKDMHSERDYLVKFIFPELRERCLHKGINLVDIDLRWGVTEKEAEEGKSLMICLDEIENCRPFFIGILGERYGWTPDHYDVPEYQRYDWLKEIDNGHSITALEIYQGVLNTPLMHSRAFFYFRDPAFIKDVPISKQAEVVSENSQSAAKLSLLKEKIRATFASSQSATHITEGYTCKYKGIKINWAQVKADIHEGRLSPEDNRVLDNLTKDDNLISTKEYSRLNASQKEITERYGIVYLEGLEAFGEKVRDQVWQAIEEEYPDTEAITDPLRIENKYHDNFVNQATRFFVGREDTLEEISRYIHGEDLRPLFLTGEAGSGKSAIIARASLNFKSDYPDAICITRFIGASPSSLNITRLIKNIIQELGSQLGFIPNDDRMKEHDALWKYFIEVLQKCPTDKKIFIVIDAVNQLNPFTSPSLLTWLPKTLPVNVKIILSSLEGAFTSMAKDYNLPFILVGKLDKSTSREIIVQKLGLFRKALSDAQMSTLLKKEDAVKPLYLSIACEELRTFPRFEEIGSFISGLPDHIPQLFEQVLDKLEKDHGHILVKDALCLLESSMYGLSEDELLDLLKRDGEDKLPANIWARLSRNISPYLNNAGELKEGLLDFFHQQLSLAVHLRYLQRKEEENHYYIQLANYAHRSHLRFPGIVTNCLKFTGIYAYKVEDAKSLQNIVKYFFSSKQYAPVYETVFEELFDFVSDHYETTNEHILTSLLMNVSVEQKNNYAQFLRKKGLQYKNTGKSEWGLVCLTAASIAVEQLVKEAPAIFNYRQWVASLCNETAQLMLQLGRKDDANVYFKKATLAIEELVNMAPHIQEFQRELSVSYNNSGKKYLAERKMDEALTMFKKSMNIRENLLKEEPDSVSLLLDMAVSYSNIGNVFEELEQWKEAEEFYLNDLEKMNILLRFHPDNTEYIREASITLSRLGNILYKQGNLQKALDYMKNSIEMIEQAITYAPSRTDFLSVLANKINNLGHTYQDLDNVEKALELYKKGLKIREKLLEKEPGRADFRLELAANLWKIYQLSPIKEAIGWLEKSYSAILPIEEMEIKDGRQKELSYMVRRDLGMIYGSMARGLYNQGHYSEALDFYEKSNSILRDIDMNTPDHIEMAVTFLNNFKSMGEIYTSQNNIEQALESYINAENIVAGVILKFEPENTDMQLIQAKIYSRAGELYMENKDYDNAINLLGAAIRIYQNLMDKITVNDDLHLNLSMNFYHIGVIFAATGQKEKAYTGFLNAASYRQRLNQSDPENKEHWITLATLYWNIYGFCPSNEKEMWLERSGETIQSVVQSSSVENDASDLYNMIMNELKEKEGAD